MRPQNIKPDRTIRPKVFLDSSALIAALISRNAGAFIRRLLALGEQGVIDLRVSGEVISDAERFARKRTDNAALLRKLALLIIQSDIATVADPSEETIRVCEAMTGYRPDARILAAAIECDADVLLTLDSTHLLGNPRIVPPDVSVLVLNDKECLDWCFEQWKRSARPD